MEDSANQANSAHLRTFRIKSVDLVAAASPNEFRKLGVPTHTLYPLGPAWLTGVERTK